MTSMQIIDDLINKINSLQTGVNRSVFLDTLRDSEFFDSNWYNLKYNDVAQSGIDALEHYLNYGYKEGRLPSGLFEPYAQVISEIASNDFEFVDFIKLLQKKLDIKQEQEAIEPAGDLKQKKANIQEIITDEKCTGCCACMNICPTLAISMEENNESFIMPRVDNTLCLSCGKCVVVCPPLDVIYKNNPDPQCYVFRANDEITAKSSSGGFFTALAESVLRNGGIVSGVAFDNEFNARNMLAANTEELGPMRRSKYVQSYPDFIYKKIKILLDKGQHILFTGTPCQVAALNSFLGKEYENLLCADLICSGVPSQAILHKYLQEVARGRMIKQISFRDKRYGWVSDVLRIEFVDGSIYEGHGNADPYETGLHRKIFLRKSCTNCPFCDFPRQGDLSMGDFCGVDKIVTSIKDADSISMVLTNTIKGETYLTEIDNKSLFIKIDTCDLRTLPNRMHTKIDIDPARERFFSLFTKKTFNKAVEYATTGHYDIGCIGYYSDGNFGSEMTYYALYHVLEDMGYATLMIDRPMTSVYKPLRSCFH